jgi:hypothetical protein
MRHGGDGDLTKAYKFAKKDMLHNAEGEQPFPDSWIATTGPVALGCLTDIASEIILAHGAEGAIFLWPCVGDVMRRWCNGEVKVANGRQVPGDWTPCEALVRIATSEIIRFSDRLAERLEKMSRTDAEVWSNAFISYFTETLNQTLDMEVHVKKELLDQKILAYKKARRLFPGSFDSEDSPADHLIGTEEKIELITPFGKGTLVDRKINDFGAGRKVKVDVIKLNYGMLYTPSTEQPKSSSPTKPPVSPTTNGKKDDSLGWVKLVPVLKVRCIAAYFLHHALATLKQEAMISCLAVEMATGLLQSLSRSRKVAELSVKNEDLAHAFQEAMLSEWGDDEEMGEEALVNIARLSQTQGSAMFFLTQTAGATQASMWLLSALFEFKTESADDNSWDRESFAAPHLLEIIRDVLIKFVDSESREGHRIDPNVWRNTTESGVKVALYCTSFASVVVGLLNVMLSFDDDHMKLHGAAFFPMICRLVPVQSDEIRLLVQRILLEKFGPVVMTASLPLAL